jgi:uncharacterized protein YbjT (DUF2867 family)
MTSGARFAELDRRAADNFGRAARRAGVRRIIYLGGLADDAHSLSTHLKSRVETGEALRGSGVPVVEFRASIVIGAGSLSFEMIRGLVERLPAMICPTWVDTRTQPIAIDDVLAYLLAALELPQGREGVFEIGGPEVVSYGDMMRAYAKLRGLRRVLIPVPVLTPRLSGLWLGLVTPAQARVGRALVEGLRNPTAAPPAGTSPTRCGGCAGGLTASWAASACPGADGIPKPVPSATSSMDGASRCMSQTVGCASRRD